MKNRSGSVALLCLLVMWPSARASAAAISVDPAGYAGLWSISSVTAWASGPATVSIDPGSYLLSIGDASYTAFSVDANGIVSTNSTRLNASGSSITFSNVSVTFDPGSYLGQWALNRASPNGGWQVGTQTLTLVPAGTGADDAGNAYWLDFGCCSISRFSVDAAGNISSNSTRFAASVGNIVFATTPVSIDPGAYAGYWGLDRSTPGSHPLTGPHTVDLVVGGTGSDDFVSGYWVSFGCCSISRFKLDPDGSVLTASSRLGASGSAMMFQTVSVVIDPGSFVGEWALQGESANWLSGAQTVDLVPKGMTIDDNVPGEWRISLRSGDTAPFDALSPCAIDTHNASAPGQLDVGGTTFNVTCDMLEAPDSDGDGVNDADDICPLTPPGVAVSSQGCSGAQWIELSCVNDSSNHGKYVHCVAHAAQDAVAMGLLSPEQKGRFVRDAAHSK